MPSDVDAALRSIALAIEADLPALTEEMTEWFVGVIPEFRHDETLRRLMVASTSSNLVAILDVLAHAIPVEQIAVPPAAGEYARRFAQHSLSLEALLRAYRLGENAFLQRAIAALGCVDGVSAQTALAALAELSRLTNSYVDRVVEGLIDIYEGERQRWNSRTGAALAGQIRLVLESEDLTEEAAGRLLGVPLAGWHQAAVIWLPAEAPEPAAALRSAARTLQDVTGSGRPLSMFADERTLWAWSRHPAPGRDDLARLQQDVSDLGGGVRVALGARGRGLSGFRGSLREALRARAVAEVSATAEDLPPVVAFDDVAVVAFLHEESGDLDRWVARVLGGLAADDRGVRELRETTRVFLRTGGSFTQAAALLHVHKNTVHYRVDKAEALRGRPLTEDRLDLEVALSVLAVLRRT